jgi:hypothetical protein
MKPTWDLIANQIDEMACALNDAWHVSLPRGKASLSAEQEQECDRWCASILQESDATERVPAFYRPWVVIRFLCAKAEAQRCQGIPARKQTEPNGQSIQTLLTSHWHSHGKIFWDKFSRLGLDGDGFDLN